MTMSLKAALDIVHNLATQNALDVTTCDQEQVTQAARQKEALDLVEATFLKALRSDSLYGGAYALPFSTTGELKIPLHALCWPSHYMSIQDARGVTVMVVPAVIEKGDTPDSKVINREKTLALTIQLVSALNMSAAL